MNISDTPKRIAIFRPGDLVSTDGRAISFSMADLHAIAASYDPALAKAPLVVGHPKIEDPAYGWATKLTVEDDTLMAEVNQVEVQFAALVNEGRYPNRSASIFLPTTPGNPKPGQLYLKHIGFLGAAPPAVVGLPPAQLAAHTEAVTFSFPATPNLELFMDPKNPTSASKTQANPDDPATFAARDAALNQREADIAERERKFAEGAAQAERASAVTFAAGLVKAGKVLPAQQDAVVELLVALPGSDAPVEFAQGTTKVSRPARDVLRELLDSMPVKIDYRTKTPAGQDAAPVSFAAPAGASVDSERGDQYAQIKALQASNPKLSVVEAARLVGA